MWLSDRSSLSRHPVVPVAQLSSPSRVPCLVIPVQWALVCVRMYDGRSGAIANSHVMSGGCPSLGVSDCLLLLLSRGHSMLPRDTMVWTGEDDYVMPGFPVKSGDVP